MYPFSVEGYTQVSVPITLDDVDVSCHGKYRLETVIGKTEAECSDICDKKEACNFFFFKEVKGLCSLYSSCEEFGKLSVQGTTFEKGI